MPGKPDIKLTKTCSPAAFGGSLECTVRLINVGDVAPSAGAGCSGRPKVKITKTSLSTFSGPGVRIALEYTVTSDPQVKPVTILIGNNDPAVDDWLNVLGVNQSVPCFSEFTLSNGTGAILNHVGLNIVKTANAAAPGPAARTDPG